MKNIIFVCHGNICRSVAAEYIMKNKLAKYEMLDRFNVISRATSKEEIGNDIYFPMKKALENKKIPYERHSARQISRQDYEDADYIFYMDSFNKRNLSYLIDDYKQIIFPITIYTPHISQIDDPWYTGQFDEVVEQLEECIDDIIQRIK